MRTKGRYLNGRKELPKERRKGWGAVGKVELTFESLNFLMKKDRLTR